MKINIQARGFELTDGLRDQTERRLRYALSWADDHLRQVSVRLSSEGGPRRGKNLRCRIQIDFPRAQDVVVDNTETDWSVAIDRAADRASRSVALLLERQRDHRHGPLLTPSPADPVTLSLH